MTSEGSKNTPRLAVVGHPNKGKSSIVATLAQDDSVYIDRLSGSTTRAQYFPLTVDGETLYELVDTPGFQRARAVLDWLKKHCQNVSQRAAAIEDFFQQHQQDSRFEHELELLKPIINNAGIIYVVDGSRPYGPEYEAEMEILLWTGRPSLALINPIDNSDYVDDWNNALGQYFKTVRIFNAQTAEYKKRIGLLEIFGQLDPEWQQPLKRAVECLTQLRQQQHRQASLVVSDCLVDILQHSEKQALPSMRLTSNISDEAIKNTLTKKFEHKIRNFENRCRHQVSEIFNHYQLQVSETEIDFLQQDLFDQNTWYLFGLNKKQLVTTAMAAGASAGALVDIGTGGHSLLLGSAIGGLAGGVGAWRFSEKIATFSIKGLPTGGKTLSYGPITNLNFPFVFLGRALQHHRLLCKRTHASREVLNINTSKEQQLLVARFPQGTQSKLMNIFKNIKRFKKVSDNRDLLSEIIFEKIRTVDD